MEKSWKSLQQRASLKLIAVLGAIAILGFTTVGHYGASWDEATEISTVKYNFELIAKGQPIPRDLKYYGVLFNFTAEAVYQVKEVFRQGLNYSPLKDQNLAEGDRGLALAIHERLKVKHPVTFLVSLLAYIAVAGMVGILAGWQYAWLAPVFLLLFPRFWGHSFFNPKDIPFAAAFTFTSWLGAYLIEAYLQTPPAVAKLGKNRLTLSALFSGVLVGLVTGMRIGGFFLVFFLPLAHLLTGLGQGNLYQKVFRFWPFYFLTAMAWAVTTTLIHPASWSNPAVWFLKTLEYLSKHAWPGKNLFEGRTMAATEIPWYYLPQWLHITIPVIFQIAFVVGLILLALNYKKLSTLQRASAILILLQVFFLPGIAVLRQSALYNAERQFLFVLPGVAAISALAFVWLYQRLPGKWVKLGAIALCIVLLSPIAADAIAIHPYQYAYFNRLAGGLGKTHQQYDQDYWGLSLREGMEWLNQNAEPNATVSIGGQQYLAQMYANPSFKFLDIEKDLDYGRKAKSDYYLAMNYMNLETVFPDCAIVHQVQRQGAPLATIKKCI